MKAFAPVAVILSLLLPAPAAGSICTGPNGSPNWYGSVGYPPYFTRNDPEKCPQKYSLSRCEQSAVMNDGTSNFATDDSGNEVCTPNKDCLPTKQNCNDTLSCSDLVKLKDELMQGGHNIVCRHEKTYWQQYTGEVKNCHLNANCMDPEVAPTQRQLQPWGWKSSNEFAKSFREMGIPVGKTFSSPFSRCAQHADLFSDEPNEERLELLYMGGWKEVLAVNNITEMMKPNALKWQAYNMRNFAGKKPSPGTNNIMVTHGFNIKLAFGTAVDEGYCMVLKPVVSEPALAESVGSLTVANQVFKYDSDSFPVDAIARMSPESALLMQTCDDVRSDAIDSNGSDNILTSMDLNHDMKVTKDEFTSALGGPLDNSGDAFEFIRSVFSQPEVLGKPTNNDEEPSIELGQFFHINWGWREFLTTGGGISYPWRFVLENTIGPMGLSTADERVGAFHRANALLVSLIEEVTKDQTKYPSKLEMEEKLLNCDVSSSTTSMSDSESQQLLECAAKVNLAESGGSSYMPVGPGDGGAGVAGEETIFGEPLAYPSVWAPDAESRSLQVMVCLVAQGSLSIAEILESMGCEADATAELATLKTASTEDETTTQPVTYILGALFVVTLLALAFVLCVQVPKLRKEIQNDGKTNDVTENETQHGTLHGNTSRGNSSDENETTSAYNEGLEV